MSRCRARPRSFMLTAPAILSVPVPKGASAFASASPDSLVAAEDVSLAFQGKPVLDCVSLDVRPSEIVTLIGPNGAGKTTLARLLLGLTPPASGKVRRLKGLRTGYVPQRF